ncbi:CPBP family intramembrane metalloprotease [Nonomuraea deserti]|uniref:CPBP family intramembrane metalloprotease n=1 Tax=Nonomuraea deserti TaxID=1848322 RepID=A0A4R4U5I3_9ACTN|nr:CPBP family intramembrane glutamic endopeptidase [Nonomuraea deserti]TDC86627.1 CPBP family intramembrane metalloprotease [Nonomuraea deserti]
MVSTENRSVLLRHLFTGAGAAVFVFAYGWLLITVTTEIAPSRDPGAPKISLWAAALPPLAAITLARLVSPRKPIPRPLTGLPRSRLLKETWTLAGAALLLALMMPIAQGLLYQLAKILFLLVVPLAAFRLIRGKDAKASAIPAPVTWLAPLPAVAAWFLLSQVGPLAVPLTQELPDPIMLIAGSLITLLTASILEEVFYRAWLQTRLEVLYGRWPAIIAQALLFALMHSSRLHPDALLTSLATIVAFQGVFGLMLGYLWARYRNIWVIFFIHTMTNLILVPMLMALL